MSTNNLRKSDLRASPEILAVIKRFPKFSPGITDENQWLADFWRWWGSHQEALGYDWGISGNAPMFLKHGASFPKPFPNCERDYSELGESDFVAMLATIKSLEELEGVANRRLILNRPDLPRYSKWQREYILQRKWELSHGR